MGSRWSVHYRDASHPGLGRRRHRQRGAVGLLGAIQCEGGRCAESVVGEDVDGARVPGGRVARVDVHRQHARGERLAGGHGPGRQHAEAIGRGAHHAHLGVSGRPAVVLVAGQVHADGPDGHLGVFLRLEEVAVGGAEDQAHLVTGDEGAPDHHHVDEVLDAPVGGLQGERHGGVRALDVGGRAVPGGHLVAVAHVADPAPEGVAQVGVPRGGEFHGQVPAGRDGEVRPQAQGDDKGVAAGGLDDRRLDGAVQVDGGQELPRTLGARHPVAHLVIGPRVGSGRGRGHRGLLASGARMSRTRREDGYGRGSGRDETPFRVAGGHISPSRDPEGGARPASPGGACTGRSGSGCRRCRPGSRLSSRSPRSAAG